MFASDQSYIQGALELQKIETEFTQLIVDWFLPVSLNSALMC